MTANSSHGTNGEAVGVVKGQVVNVAQGTKNTGPKIPVGYPAVGVAARRGSATTPLVREMCSLS